MQELLFGTWWASWGSRIVATGQQYPWAVLAAILALILVLDLMVGKGRSSGDAGVGWDGDGGDGCGD
jgi:hypothetical protein